MPASLTNFYTMVLTNYGDNFAGNNWFIVRNNISTSTGKNQGCPILNYKLNRNGASAHHLCGCENRSPHMRTGNPLHPLAFLTMFLTSLLPLCQVIQNANLPNEVEFAAIQECRVI